MPGHTSFNGKPFWSESYIHFEETNEIPTLNVVVVLTTEGIGEECRTIVL